MSIAIAGAGATDPRVVSFLANASKEAQLAYLFGQALSAQAVYLAANPANRSTLVTQSEGLNDVELRTAITIDDTALTGALLPAVQPFPFGAVKLTDAAATGAVATLLALPSLESQIVSLAITLQTEEKAYNLANPTTPVNRISLSPDYDANFVGIVALLPLSPSSTGRPIVPYLP